jgi:hypothetical protein
MCVAEYRPVEMPKGKRRKELDMRTRILRSTNAGGSMRKLAILFTAGVLLSALAVADEPDPPSRAARLSYMAGTVTFQPQGEETEWVPADLNRALTTGDKIWVEQGGRTEIQTANSVVRLNGHTNFSFLGVEGDTTQIQLSLGMMTVNLTGLGPTETYEIDTPQVAFTLLRPGLYRVEVNEAGDATVVRVRAGDGETTADGKAAPLHTNEEVVIKGNPASYDKHGVPNPDEFDAWGNERDARVANSVSVRAVAPGVVGAADLDVNGVWRPAPMYGNVWFPNAVVADWAPYRFGHWGFVAPWGWTWIDDAPWGYAPFHYGRWVMVGGLWGWAPGPIAVTAIYAPALVSFIGGLEVVGVVDPVSWVALSWGEPWYPAFGVSFGYYNSVNLCGTIFAAGIIAGVWGGAAVSLSFGHDPRAVNVVGRGGFAGGHPVGREFAHRGAFGGHAFDHAGARRDGARGIGATREGRFGGHAPLHAGARGVPPRGATGRSAVTRHDPAAHGGNFRGAGVAAKHGASANGGHAGGFKGGEHGGGAAAHNAAASHNAPAAHNSPAASHNTPAASHNAAASHSSPAASHSSPAASHSSPAASHSPAAGGSKAGAPASHSPAAGGARAGAPATHSPTAGGARAGAPATHSPAAGGARAGAPAGGGARAGAPAGGGAHSAAARPAAPAAHPSAPAIPKKK